MFKLSEEYKVINLLASTTVTGDLNGTAHDLEKYNTDGLVIVQTGAITSTGANYVVNIQGSTASAGTYTNLLSIDAFSGTASSYKVLSSALTLPDSTTAKYIRAQVDTTANAGTISAVVGVILLAKPTIADNTLNSATLA